VLHTAQSIEETACLVETCTWQNWVELVFLNLMVGRRRVAEPDQRVGGSRHS